MKTSILLLFSALAITCASNAFAAKEVFQRTKPHVNIGTIGHIDHGKTTLTLALAKAAGAPVEILTGHIPDPLVVDIVGDQDRVYRVHDFEDTVDALRTNPDVYAKGAILVVSATDGPMPQTREHILLARQVGVPSVVVYLDLDGGLYQDQVDRSVAAVRELLTGAGYDGRETLVVRGSAEGALRGDEVDLLSLADLVEALDLTVPQR